MLDLFHKADSIDKLCNTASMIKYSGNYQKDDIVVSIVIPTYKRSELLIETIKSCNPIYNDKKYEIIVVFNEKGESDNIIEYVKENDILNISIYENEENIGMFQNWNRASELASGEWISFMHDDDMFETAYFEILPTLLDRIPVETAYINFNGNIVTGEKYNEISCRKDLKLNFIKARLFDVKVLGVSPFFATTCGTLVNKKALLELGGFDDATYPSGDVLFPIKLLNNGYSCFICKVKTNYYRKLTNASLRKEVMDLFIYFYGELQKVIYEKYEKSVIYRIFKDCLYFKSVWHIYKQAEESNVTLNTPSPNQNIEKTIKYKIMDVAQRAYMKFKKKRMNIKTHGGN